MAGVTVGVTTGVTTAGEGAAVATGTMGIRIGLQLAAKTVVG